MLDLFFTLANSKGNLVLLKPFTENNKRETNTSLYYSPIYTLTFL